MILTQQLCLFSLSCPPSLALPPHPPEGGGGLFLTPLISPSFKLDFKKMTPPGDRALNTSGQIFHQRPPPCHFAGGGFSCSGGTEKGRYELLRFEVKHK